MNASGPDMPKCVSKSGHCRSQIFADSNARPESSRIHFSLVSQLERDGPSCVTVCHRERAKAYPSPVEPV